MTTTTPRMGPIRNKLTAAAAAGRPAHHGRDSIRQRRQRLGHPRPAQAVPRCGRRCTVTSAGT